MAAKTLRDVIVIALMTTPGGRGIEAVVDRFCDDVQDYLAHEVSKYSAQLKSHCETELAKVSIDAIEDELNEFFRFVFQKERK